MLQVSILEEWKWIYSHQRLFKLWKDAKKSKLGEIWVIY